MANSQFNYVSSGGSEWTLVTSATLSASGDLTFTGLDTTQDYMLLFYNTYASSTKGASATPIVISSDNGSTWISSGYYRASKTITTSADAFATSTGASAGGSADFTGIGSTNNCGFKMVFTKLASGKYFEIDGWAAGGSGNIYLLDGNRYGATTAINAVKITVTIAASGTFKYYLYKRDAIG